jgi:hypothetical protein
MNTHLVKTLNPFFMKKNYTDRSVSESFRNAGKFHSAFCYRAAMLVLLLVASLSFESKAGDINMYNGTMITTCSDNFYDGGGAFSVYAANQDKVLTIYPATPGSKVSVSFTSFDVEDGYDSLYIYDGSSTAATLLGSYTGTSGPGTVTSTASDGSLTFVFHSDSYVETDGWEATVSCSSLSACSGTITAGTAASSATTVCSGMPVVLSLSGFTAASGISYQWESSTTGLGGWTSITGATTVPYIFAPPVGTLYYRCVATCAASSSTANSSNVVVTVSGSSLPYFEDFESTSPGSGSFPPCTKNDYTGYGEGYYVHSTSTIYSWYPTYLDNHTPGGSNFLFAGYYLGQRWPDYADDFYYLPAFNLSTGKTYQFSFWYVTDGYDPYTLGAYIGTNQDRSSMTTALAPDIYVNNNFYEEYVQNFTVGSNGYYFIGLKVKGAYWYAMNIDDIGLMELPPCTGTPSVAGKANVSPATICSGPGSATLSVSGTAAVSGLTFQWYEASALAGPYTLITGATSNPYVHSGISSSKYYFCKVGCSAGGGLVNTDTVNVKVAPLTPPYIEDFETGVYGTNMPCASHSAYWDMYSYWYLYAGPHPWSSLENHTPGGSKWLFAGAGLGPGTGSSEYWFSPAINFTAGKAYNLKYWYKTDGYGIPYTFGARLGNSQSSSAMTTSIGTDISSTTSTYTEFTGDFVCGTTGAQYIGIKFEASNWYDGGAIDDIGLTQLPPCSAKPSAGIAKATPSMICSASGGPTTLTLEGLSAASDLNYQWQVSTTGPTGTYSNIAGATTPAYTTGLITVPSCFRCVVTCPLIAAPNSDISVSTCVTIGPLTPPYIETFESAKAGVNQPCASYTYGWEAGTGTGSFSYWGIKDMPGMYFSSIDNHTPGGSKYLSAGYMMSAYYIGSSSDEQYWFTPPLQLTGGMAYKCNYWYVTSGYTYRPSTTFGLYYGTSQSASAMTAMTSDASGETNTTYKEIVGSFTPGTTGVYYIGVKVNNDYGYYGVAIDDIGVEQLPLCTAKPTAGIIKSIPTLICSSGTAKFSLLGTSMASKLTFQWQDSTATGWNNVSTGTGGATANYTSGTLVDSRKYRCIVTCPLIGTPNADTTPVYLMNVGAITPPYIETFESGTAGINMPCASNTYSWSSDIYWYLYGTDYSSSYPAIINHTPGGSKYLYGGYGLGYYSGSKEYWFSPAIKFTAGDTYEFSYWYNGSDYAGGSTTLGMYYGTTQSAGSMIPVRSDLPGVNTGSYKQMIGRFVAPGSGNYYLGVMLRHTAFTYPGVAIDDIGLIQLPPCTGAPTVGAISASPSMLCSAGGTVSLDMDMAAVSKASGLSYRWEYTTTDPASGFTPAGSSAALTSPLYTSTALGATTWFRCIVKCTLTGDSTISTIKKVDVGVIVPPYIETFESGTAGVNMPCASYTWGFGGYWYWNLMSSSLTYGPSPLENHTTGGSKFLIGGYEIGYYSGAPEFWFTPAIKFTAGKLYQLSYWYKSDNYGGATYTIETYLGASQTKAAMTTPIGTSVTPGGMYKMFKNQFTAATSADLYIGFKKSQSGFGYGIAIDDIGLQEVPPCSSPVAAGTIFAEPIHICASGGTTQLDLAGSSLATGLTYEWLSATSAAGPYTSVGTSLPYNTDPLTANTWFKAVITCSATLATDTTPAFMVGVGAFELPYKEDFESTSAGSVPLCSDATYWGTAYWDGWRVQGSLITGAYKNHTPGGKNYLIGGYYLGSYISPSEDNYWFTPGLNLRGGYKYNLSFYYLSKYSGYDNAKMGVYYGTSQTIAGMSRNLIPYREFSNTAYELYDTTFLMPSSGIYYFGFRKSGSDVTDLSAYGVAFDDINLNYAPCDAMPNAGTIVGDKPSGTQFCPGTKVTLTDIGATISLVPGIKFQWQRRSLITPTLVWSNVAGATDTVLVADTLVGYEYRFVTVCKNTNDSAFSAAFHVPQFPPHPPVAISPSTSPTIYCLGDTVKFTATNFSGAVYDWMLDSVVIPGWKFSDMGATEPGTYMVKVTSALSVCPGYSNQVKLIINDPGYTVDITKPADSIICVGSSVMLNGFASKSGVTFQWRKDNVPIPGATSGSLMVTSTGYYRITASDGVSACAAVSRNVLITVKPNPPAVITVPGGSTTGCANPGVRLDANVGGFSYEWLRSGGTMVGWTDSSQIITSSGSYVVKVRTSDGCVSFSSPVSVTILPSPVPIITKTALMLGVTASFSTYQWVRNGVDIPGAIASTYPLSLKGYYKVRVTDINGCVGESTPIEVNDNGLSIDNLNAKTDEIKIYPNPTSAKVFIESPISLDVEVKDAAGKSVLKAKDTKQVDLGKYADGIYLFIITNNGELIKQQRVTKASR